LKNGLRDVQPDLLHLRTFSFLDLMACFTPRDTRHLLAVICQMTEPRADRYRRKAEECRQAAEEATNGVDRTIG
jgi:hypothetical protein